MKARTPRVASKLALALVCALLVVVQVQAQTETKDSAQDESDTDSSGGDLSDGSDIKVTQPLLKATDWFITEEEILFDDRLPLVASSHHQKTIVIAANKSTGKDEHPIAYVGGIDLTNDRWDTIYHNNTAIRKAANIPYRNNGWIDAHFRIHGPAAKEVANNFLQRWNSDYKPCQGLDDDVLSFDNPDYEKLPQHVIETWQTEHPDRADV
ncbi:unnamed protein product [Phytophthora lilii]|uniref:Unnamed protein product n=1 Tax=Phytophthora lilii TaxID=2077276 RepID=A0A9W7CHQ6_9STRA|nr:unnamed protein product [Phytophthora lilii]